MTFKAYYRKDRILLFTILSLIWIALGLWGFLSESGLSNGRINGLKALIGEFPTRLLLGGTNILLGAACAFTFARTLLHHGPSIQVNANGIYWDRWSPDPIPWSNIADIKLFPHHTGRIAALFLRDPKLNPCRARNALRYFAGRNRTFGDVPISLRLTHRTLAYFFEATERYSKQQRHSLEQTMPI